jgi:hypothetical protein
LSKFAELSNVAAEYSTTVAKNVTKTNLLLAFKTKKMMPKKQQKLPSLILKLKWG